MGFTIADAFGRVICRGEGSLRGANLRKGSLRGADLHGAGLYGADLRGADLRGADLRGADLRGANLRGADLRGADLYGADLYGANLRGANLYGANLYGADLYGADLYGANLRGANLRGAQISPAGVVAYVHGVLCVGPLGSRGDTLQVFATDRGVWVVTGCFAGFLGAFADAVIETHAADRYAAQYLAVVSMLKVWAESLEEVA